MGVFENVKATIDVNINANGEQRITGKVLNGVLQEIVSASESSSSDLQESLSSLSEKVDNIGSKDFNPSGTYPDLTAGDLAGRGESVPASFGFRASGGKSIKDGRAYIKRIKGNSVVWNNMVDTRGYEAGFIIREGIKIQQGHKYLLQRSAANNGLYLIPVVGGSENYEMSLRDGEYAKICTSQYTDLIEARVYSESYCGACVISDLTKMFQAGNEPTTIEDFYARVATLGIDMYAYNEGEVIHCNTESIKSVGDNAWDEQWENGTINVNTGDNIDAEYAQQQIRSKNLIRVLPNEDYYIALPQYLGSDGMWVFFYDEQGRIIEGHNGGSGEVVGNASLIRANDGFMHTASNASYIKFYMVSGYGSTYNHDILISLYHSGWKAEMDDQYRPYWQDTLPLPIIRKYFPDGMKKAGTAHDEIRFNKASGKWEKVVRIGSVDLGSLEWATGNDSIFIAVLNDMNPALNTITGIMAKYSPCTSANGFSMISGDDKTYITNGGAVGGAGRFTIKDTSYTDAASFKAAMQGVMFYYELAEPIVTEITEDFRDYYNVADFGTEQSQSNVPSAAFSADIIYQFNAVDMIREHETEINELQKVIATMQAQLTSLTSPTNL